VREAPADVAEAAQGHEGGAEGLSVSVPLCVCLSPARFVSRSLYLCPFSLSVLLFLCLYNSMTLSLSLSLCLCLSLLVCLPASVLPTKRARAYLAYQRLESSRRGVGAPAVQFEPGARFPARRPAGALALDVKVILTPPCIFH
jgi:hypothetical protein